MERYAGPVNPAYFDKLSIIFMIIGMTFTAKFLTYAVTTPKQSRSILQEVILAFFCSLFLGAGTLFLMLSVGIYV
uniref:Transmembrane protein 258 n=1 Tax=Rhabditophanes sp. KR3021 TaxID=114890 RepID=A0AC35TX80_9BILA